MNNTEIFSVRSVNWPMEIVTEVVTLGDGLVRDVTGKMSKGLSRIDVRKSCLLEGTDG